MLSEGKRVPPGGLNRARFGRIYVIDREVRRGRYPSIKWLAEKLEVTTRTIQRDVAYMRDQLGAPLEWDSARKGYTYGGREKEFTLPQLHLTEGELIALYLGQKLLSQYSGTPYEEPIRSAFEKVCLLLPETVSVDLSLVDQIVSFNVEPIRGDEEKVLAIYSALAGAIANKRIVWMRYYSASSDKVAEREVDPYHLRFYEGAWYLIGYCHLRKEVRTFALDRILDIKVTEDGFDFPASFSLHDYLKDAFGLERGPRPVEVVILFDAHEARWIRERVWHPSQDVEIRPDGSLLLRLKVSGLGDIKRWLIGFGAHAQIISPPSLRQEVAEEIRALQKLYEDKQGNPDQ